MCAAVPRWRWVAFRPRPALLCRHCGSRPPMIPAPSFDDELTTRSRESNPTQSILSQFRRLWLRMTHRQADGPYWTKGQYPSVFTCLSLFEYSDLDPLDSLSSLRRKLMGLLEGSSDFRSDPRGRSLDGALEVRQGTDLIYQKSRSTIGGLTLDLKTPLRTRDLPQRGATMIRNLVRCLVLPRALVAAAVSSIGLIRALGEGPEPHVTPAPAREDQDKPKAAEAQPASGAEGDAIRKVVAAYIEARNKGDL